jgi:hypothetical protein
VKLPTHLRRLVVLILVLGIGAAACNPAPSNPAPVATAAQATFTPPAAPTAVPATAVPPTQVPPTPEPTLAPTATLTPTAAVPAQVTANDLLNVRAGPGTTYPLLGQLTAGQTVEATGRNEESTWWQIQFADGPGGRGWVLGDFVTPNDQTGTLPVVTVAPAPTQPPAPTKPAAPPPTAAATQPPAAAYAAPTLLSPADGATFTGQGITIMLNWSSVGELRSGDCYKVRINHKEGIYDSECLSGTSWRVQEWLFKYRPEDRQLQWSVRVVDANNNAVSPWSATWSFVWYGG